MEDFFDRFKNITGVYRYSSSEVITPLNIVKDMVDLIPSDVFHPDAKFIDIAVKSGRFLAEIYRKLMESPLLSHMNESDRHNHIINNQLYGAATSEFAASMVRKQLYDDATIRGNIVYKNEKISKELIQGAFGNMKFDVVIGNPPYNNDIYLDFVELGHKLSSKYCCMITPAKWQAKTDGKPKGSKTIDKNEQFRQNIVPYMTHIVFYPCTEDIFNIREASGISYYLIDKHKKNTEDTFVKIACKRNNIIESDFEAHDETKIALCNRNILSVIGKVGTLGEGFKQSLYVKNTDHGEISIDGTLGFKRQVFTGEQDRGESLKQAGYVEVMQGEKVVGYRKIEDLFTTNKLDKWKVTTSVMAGNIYLDDAGKTLGIVPCNIIGPYQVPKGSYPVLRYFDTEEECKSFKSYYESKLVSFLFYFAACGTTLTKEFYRYIPCPSKFDHIFSDQELYEKYNLTEEDIKIIESVIKERK